MHRAEWAPPSDILSYLLTAVRNRALDVLRAEKRHTHSSRHYAEKNESPAMAEPGRAADTILEDDERRAAVWRVIQTLPEQRRTVLMLRWQHELEWAEIARIMHTTEAAVRMNHSRALKLLRQWLPNAIE